MYPRHRLSVNYLPIVRSVLGRPAPSGRLSTTRRLWVGVLVATSAGRVRAVVVVVVATAGRVRTVVAASAGGEWRVRAVVVTTSREWRV